MSDVTTKPDRVKESADLDPIQQREEAGPGTAADASMLGAAASSLGGGVMQRKIAQRLARKAGGGAERDGDKAGAAVDKAAQSSGAPIDAPIARKVEAATGADLSGVRVHTGAESQQAAGAVNAKAYTVGQDVHFAAGQYQPGTKDGDRLIAHELIHTVQQGGSGGSMQTKLEVSQPGDSSELQADQVADSIVDGNPGKGSLAVGASAGAAIARKGTEPGEGGDKVEPAKTEPAVEKAPVPAAPATGEKSDAKKAEDEKKAEEEKAKAPEAVPKPGERMKVWAALMPQIAALPMGVMGAHQRGRIAPAVDAMADGDFTKFRAVIDGAGSLTAQGFLFKAAAANNSIADIEWLAGQIKGKDADWLIDNCTLGDTRATGKGTKQQFSHTCGVTTVQTIRGEYDPVYALKLRQANTDINSVDDSDANKVNPNMAAEQKKMTETAYGGTAFGAHKGKAVDRDKIAQGSGRWVDDWLNSLKAQTGLQFTTLLGPAADAAITTLKDKVGAGMQTPTVIGNGPGAYTHYILCMNTRTNPAGKREFQFHDPWGGVTVWKTEDDIKNGTLNIAGSNMITALEVPSAAP